MLKVFLNRYSSRQIVKLILEDHLRFLIGNLPCYEGVWLRRTIYRSLFKSIGKYSIIAFDVTITHAFNIVVGDYFAVNSCTHIDGRGGISFGDHVLIGPNVFIGSSNHKLESCKEKPRIFFGHEMKTIKIGSNVWIGANAVICPGVTIGDNSVIAAGSVVTKNIPESTLVAGNPANIVKSITEKT